MPVTTTLTYLQKPLGWTLTFNAPRSRIADCGLVRIGNSRLGALSCCDCVIKLQLAFSNPQLSLAICNSEYLELEELSGSRIETELSCVILGQVTSGILESQAWNFKPPNRILSPAVSMGYDDIVAEGSDSIARLSRSCRINNAKGTYRA